MRHLNYNHLLYFWTVAREGSIAKATQTLHLTPQTISGQLKLLEESVGEPLFTRVGRGLAMTETGHMVYQYADEIFTLGAELTSRVKTGRVVVPAVLAVGVVNSIPKLVASRILQPVLQSEISIRLVCREGALEGLGRTRCSSVGPGVIRSPDSIGAVSKSVQPFPGCQRAGPVCKKRHNPEI